MTGLFGFMDMADNYDERAVARHEANGLIVDTCLVTDSEKPYETGISHKGYNGGSYVIAEMYNTEEEAQQGHDKWVKIMTADELPKELEDVSSATVAALCDLGGESWRTFQGQ